MDADGFPNDDAVAASTSIAGVVTHGNTRDMGDNGSSPEVQSQSDVTSLVDVLHYALGTPLACLIIAGNLWILYLMKQNKGLLHPSTIIGHLLLADIFAGVTLLVGICLIHVNDDFEDSHPYLCDIWSSIQLLPIHTMFVFLLALSVDRFQAAVTPARYADSIIHRRPGLVCALIWLYGLFIALIIYVFNPKHNENPTSGLNGCKIAALPLAYAFLVMVGHVAPAAIVSVVLFTLIVRILRIHQCKIQVTNTLTYDTLLDDANLAKLYFVLAMVTFGLWVPFILCLVALFIETDNVLLENATQYSLLVGYVSNLHFVILLVWSEKLRGMSRETCCVSKQTAHPIRNRSARP